MDVYKYVTCQTLNTKLKANAATLLLPPSSTTCCDFCLRLFTFISETMIINDCHAMMAVCLGTQAKASSVKKSHNYCISISLAGLEDDSVLNRTLMTHCKPGALLMENLSLYCDSVRYCPGSSSIGAAGTLFSQPGELYYSWRSASVVILCHSNTKGSTFFIVRPRHANLRTQKQSHAAVHSPRGLL